MNLYSRIKCAKSTFGIDFVLFATSKKVCSIRNSDDNEGQSMTVLTFMPNEPISPTRGN